MPGSKDERAIWIRNVPDAKLAHFDLESPLVRDDGGYFLRLRAVTDDLIGLELHKTGAPLHTEALAIVPTSPFGVPSVNASTIKQMLVASLKDTGAFDASRFYLGYGINKSHPGDGLFKQQLIVLPDGNKSVTYIPSNCTNSNSLTSYSASHVKLAERLGLDVSGKAPIYGISASTDNSFSAQGNTFSTQSSVYITSRFFTERATFRLCSSQTLQSNGSVHPHFLPQIKNALASSRETQFSELMGVLDEWGHDYISTCSVGGAKYSTEEAQVSSHAQLQSIKAKSDTKLNSWFAVAVSVDARSVSESDSQTAKKLSNLLTIGGDDAFADPRTWYNSVVGDSSTWETISTTLTSSILLLPKDVQEKVNEVLKYGPTVPVFRFLDRANNDHIYTTSLTEKQQMEEAGFVFEGSICRIFLQQAPNTVPIYRAYSDKQKNHFYTIDRKDLENRLAEGYVRQEVMGYAFGQENPPTNCISVFRLWRAKEMDTFMTSTWREANMLGKYWCEFYAYHPEQESRNWV